jgi:hypothetical protein
MGLISVNSQEFCHSRDFSTRRRPGPCLESAAFVSGKALATGCPDELSAVSALGLKQAFERASTWNSMRPGIHQPHYTEGGMAGTVPVNFMERPAFLIAVAALMNAAVPANRFSVATNAEQFDSNSCSRIERMMSGHESLPEFSGQKLASSFGLSGFQLA